MMPFYTDAYLADTGHLSLEENGAYLKLLFVMWRAGGTLPDDDTKVARYLSITIGKWKKIKPTISEFFTYEDGQFSQKKLQKIFKKQMENKNKFTEGGIKGAEAKKLKNIKTPTSPPSTTLELGLNHPISPPTSNLYPITYNLKEGGREYVDGVARDPGIEPVETPPPASPPAEWLSESVKAKGWSEATASAIWEAFRGHYAGKTKPETNWKVAWCKWWETQHFRASEQPYGSAAAQQELTPEERKKNRHFYLKMGFHHPVYNPDILKLKPEEIED